MNWFSKSARVFMRVARWQSRRTAFAENLALSENNSNNEYDADNDDQVIDGLDDNQRY